MRHRHRVPIICIFFSVVAVCALRQFAAVNGDLVHQITTATTMDEMKEFARALLQCKSFKDRQECLSESLDNFSFEHPNLYFMLFKEIKRRELESNDQNKIRQWLMSTPQSNYYAKLHEALMLVKSHNIIAKEELLDSTRKMLHETIENGTNMETAKKICCLIEKSPHLKNVHEILMDTIKQVKKLVMKHCCNKTSIWNDDNKLPDIVDSSERFRAEDVSQVPQPQQQQQQQHQHTSIWTPMLQSNNLKTAQGFPYFNFECFGYDRLEVIATADRRPTFDFSQIISNLTIIDQEMDGVVAKWLHYLKLHKYQWFFNELSYLEIEFIDEDNIEGFINKVNRNAITKGAQKKICISTKTLRGRKQKLQDLLMALDLEVTPNELCEIITYMRDILHYPIPNRNCVVGDQLQQDIVSIMEKFLSQLLEKLNGTRYLNANSLLGTSINKYLECSLLITSNQIFMKEQIDKMEIFVKTLKSKVIRMPKNFN